MNLLQVGTFIVVCLVSSSFGNTFRTSAGLDASSAFKLLTILNELANPSGASESPDGCKRAVILTIHQPRLDIFYMFDKLLLLSDGKVDYFMMFYCPLLRA